MNDKVNNYYYDPELHHWCSDYVKHMKFMDGSAFKYIWRAGRKPGEPEIKDLKKAEDYLNAIIKEMKDNPLADLLAGRKSIELKRCLIGAIGYRYNALALVFDRDYQGALMIVQKMMKGLSNER